MTRHAARELTFYHDDDGSLVIRARLPAEQGAVVLQALNAAMDAETEAEASNAPTDVTAVTSTEASEAANDVTAVTSADANRFAQRRADALTAMAETTLRHSAEPLSLAERYQVVVHVSAETLAAGDGDRCELDRGPRLAPDTARRIACDSSLLTITEDAAGHPLDIGRKTRAVPPAMQRALRARDRGCRFPGCTRHRFVDAHHIRHWANGGETSLDNLVLLCRQHHRLVHEGGFEAERIEDGTIRFTRPDGRVITEQPELPGARVVDAMRKFLNSESGQPIDAADWVIPEGVINLDLAITGLVQLKDRPRPSR